MFEVRDQPDPLETLALVDQGAQSSVCLAPARGGMVTRWTLRGHEVLYLDEATLRDPGKNVRGGIPVLFPSPGRLLGDGYTHDGKSGSLGQHGFARNLEWKVSGRSTAEASVASLRLVANAATQAVFPWDFALDYRYSLRGPVLRIEQQISNTGSDTMPFGAGFHPYFCVAQSQKGETLIPTAATSAFDAVKQQSGAFAIDLLAPEVDLRLLDHGARPCRLQTPSMDVELSGSPEYGHWVVWTLQGKDFVCVEPWTCPANALNSGEHLLELAPGEVRTLWVEIAVTLKG
ncbi:MAG TPA: galactose mutarotase [Polyangiaceae bacterium]|nr:galactose mutarotase [Polyangiaceae bacterium]